MRSHGAPGRTRTALPRGGRDVPRKKKPKTRPKAKPRALGRAAPVARHARPPVKLQRRRDAAESFVFSTEPRFPDPWDQPLYRRLELVKVLGKCQSTVDYLLRHDPRVRDIVVRRGRNVFVRKGALDRLIQSHVIFRTRPLKDTKVGSSETGGWRPSSGEPLRGVDREMDLPGRGRDKERDG